MLLQSLSIGHHAVTGKPRLNGNSISARVPARAMVGSSGPLPAPRDAPGLKRTAAASPGHHSKNRTGSEEAMSR